MTTTHFATTKSPVFDLLDQQLRIASTLEALLMAEYAALLASDLDQLADLVTQKRAAAESLERSSVALTQHTGASPEAVIVGLGGNAPQQWQLLGEMAERLRRQNFANGALLNERQNRLRWVAERANGGTAPLYAPHAAPGFASALSGRSLARA